MDIRIESSSASGLRPTGVGYYTKRLIESLELQVNVSIRKSQFDFLGRQLQGEKNIERVNFPQKIYAKLDYFGVAPPFDLTLPSVDVTIFPNYALWSTIRTKKRIVTVHDLSFLYFPEVVESKNLTYLRKVVPRSVEKADLVLTVSDTIKGELVDKFSLSPDKIHVTPIPPSEDYYLPSDRRVRDIYGIPTKEYILFASTVEPRKNLQVVLDAYSLLPAEIQQKYSLVVAGGMGWKSDAIKAKLETMQQEYPHIITTGYYDQQDAAALFQQASVFVMPSLYEGFGMPLLEAMAGETPTIASDIPVFREVCGDASLFFNPENPNDLASTITRCLTDKKLSDGLIVKGTKNLKRYSWESVAKNLLTKIKEMS